MNKLLKKCYLNMSEFSQTKNCAAADCLMFCLEQDLREEMGREVDEHQHELAALQDAQRQKLADITRRHRVELAEYEERIEELEEQIHSGPHPFLQLCRSDLFL